MDEIKEFETVNEEEIETNENDLKESGSNPLLKPKFIVGAITAAGLTGAAITAGVTKLLKKGKDKSDNKVKKRLKIRNPFYYEEETEKNTKNTNVS